MIQNIDLYFGQLHLNFSFRWHSFFRNYLEIILRFQYTAEVYPTKIRTTGIGMANGIGRLGGVIMPWICMYMNSKELRSPFILFSVLSLITSCSNFLLPFETLGKELEWFV